MRILHAANFQFSKFGQAFWNQDQKIHHGLMSSGHYVYAFSINDMARQLSPLTPKEFRAGKVNAALIKTCETIRPDLLVLGHAQSISAQTVLKIRDILPKIKIALWYVDALWVPAKIQHLHDRAHLLDALFCTTAGEPLTSISKGKCRASFIPNSTHKDIEKQESYAQEEHEYDLIFIGSDRKDPNRTRALEIIREECSKANLRFQTFGSLGQPGIYGSAKDGVLCRTIAGLNLSRHNEQPLYSSSRIAEMMGNGLLVCSPNGANLEALYTSEEMLYFDKPSDLVQKLAPLIKEGSWKTIAKRGREKSLLDYSAQAVGQYIIDYTLENDEWKSAPWADYSYSH